MDDGIATTKNPSSFSSMVASIGSRVIPQPSSEWHEVRDRGARSQFGEHASLYFSPSNHPREKARRANSANSPTNGNIATTPKVSCDHVLLPINTKVGISRFFYPSRFLPAQFSTSTCSRFFFAATTMICGEVCLMRICALFGPIVIYADVPYRWCLCNICGIEQTKITNVLRGSVKTVEFGQTTKIKFMLSAKFIHYRENSSLIRVIRYSA